MSASFSTAQNITKINYIKHQHESNSTDIKIINNSKYTDDYLSSLTNNTNKRSNNAKPWTLNGNGNSGSKNNNNNNGKNINNKQNENIPEVVNYLTSSAFPELHDSVNMKPGKDTAQDYTKKIMSPLKMNLVHYNSHVINNIKAFNNNNGKIKQRSVSLTQAHEGVNNGRVLFNLNTQLVNHSPNVKKSDEERQYEQRCKLFIGGISMLTTDKMLRDYYLKYGKVTDAVIMTDRYNNFRSRGFGFVTFADPQELEAVLKHRPHVIDGKTVETKRAMPREETQNPETNFKVEKLFVGALKRDVVSHELEDYFQKFGTVVHTEIIYDKMSGESRGFGFVTFTDDDAVDLVLLNKPHYIQGKVIDVKKALSKEQLSEIQHKSNNGAYVPYKRFNSEVIATHHIKSSGDNHNIGDSSEGFFKSTQPHHHLLEDGLSRSAAYVDLNSLPILEPQYFQYLMNFMYQNPAVLAYYSSVVPPQQQQIAAFVMAKLTEEGLAAAAANKDLLSSSSAGALGAVSQEAAPLYCQPFNVPFVPPAAASSSDVDYQQQISNGMLSYGGGSQGTSTPHNTTTEGSSSCSTMPFFYPFGSPSPYLSTNVFFSPPVEPTNPAAVVDGATVVVPEENNTTSLTATTPGDSLEGTKEGPEEKEEGKESKNVMENK